MGRGRRLRHRLRPGRKIGGGAPLRTGCPGRWDWGAGTYGRSVEAENARETAWEQTYYSRGLVVTGWATHDRLYSLHFAVFCTAFTVSDALALPGMLRRFKHYHISSISLGSNVPRRLQCQFETWRKSPQMQSFLSIVPSRLPDALIIFLRTRYCAGLGIRAKGSSDAFPTLTRLDRA